MVTQPSEILIVDDSLSMRKMIKALLSQIDATVSEAENGAKGLESIRQKQYDLVITDINMPEMSGLEMCEAVRKQLGYQTLPIIVMTAYENYESVESAFRAGATSCAAPTEPSSAVNPRGRRPSGVRAGACA